MISECFVFVKPIFTPITIVISSLTYLTIQLSCIETVSRERVITPTLLNITIETTLSVVLPQNLSPRKWSWKQCRFTILPDIQIPLGPLGTFDCFRVGKGVLAKSWCGKSWKLFLVYSTSYSCRNSPSKREKLKNLATSL